MGDDQQQLLYARQGIYDRSVKRIGFELLFRNSQHADASPADFDGNYATSRVLVNAFSENHIDSVCDDQPAFVNFTADMLATAMPFSTDRLVIEVLESVPATPDNLEQLSQLRELGYRIALDDYVDDSADNPMLDYVDIVKIDLLQLGPARMRDVVSTLKARNDGLTLLAEKVETWADFEVCRDAGCHLFQGYFLARPHNVKGEPLPVEQLRIVELLAALNEPEANPDRIIEIIHHDPWLSLRLLKLTNSAAYYHVSKVTSLSRAIMVLGTKRIRAFASLLVLSELQQKPLALHYTASTRGFVCQALCQTAALDGEMGFTVGLFSCIDAFFDRPLRTIFTDVPFTQAIIDAVIDHTGKLGTILEAVIKQENGLFEELPTAKLAILGITTNDLMVSFHAGVKKANMQKSLTADAA